MEDVKKLNKSDHKSYFWKGKSLPASLWYLKSSVIRQKGGSQNGYFKKRTQPNFPKYKHFSTPDTHTYVWVSGCKKYLSGMLCFLETPVLRFALLPYYRPNARKEYMILFIVGRKDVSLFFFLILNDCIFK